MKRPRQKDSSLVCSATSTQNVPQGGVKEARKSVCVRYWMTRTIAMLTRTVSDGAIQTLLAIKIVNQNLPLQVVVFLTLNANRHIATHWSASRSLTMAGHV